MKVVCPHCNKEFEFQKPKKQYQPGEHDPLTKLRKILECLKAHKEWVWIRRIAKETHLKPYSVSYLVDKYLVNYLEILEPEEVLETTGIKMRMFKLKNPDININTLLEELKIRINS